MADPLNINSIKMKKYHHLLVSANVTDKKIGNLEPMTGVFRLRSNTDTVWKQRVVTLSWEIAKRIRARQKYDKLPVNVPYVGTEFVTKFNSPKYEDSPFRVVLFEPSKDSDIHENYLLEAVDEKGVSNFSHILKQKMGTDRKRRSIWDYYREEKRTITQSWADLEKGVKFPKPDPKDIPVKA